MLLLSTLVLFQATSLIKKALKTSQPVARRQKSIQSWAKARQHRPGKLLD